VLHLKLEPKHSGHQKTRILGRVPRHFFVFNPNSCESGASSVFLVTSDRLWGTSINSEPPNRTTIKTITYGRSLTIYGINRGAL
jgi:hypothetical protein